MAFHPGEEIVIPIPGMEHLTDVSIVYADGVPCGHAGCRHHLSHPCEGCGRVGARGIVLESAATIE